MQHNTVVIEEQLAQFKKGMQPYALIRPATLGDGILALDELDQQRYHDLYESANVRTEKFVPASGAASRMFKSLLAFKNEGIKDQTVETFFQSFADFPFGKSGLSAPEILAETFEIKQWDKCPKGLLPFHAYDSSVRSAAEEHLIEAMDYLHGQELAVHFTVSPEHTESFREHLAATTKQLGGKWAITLSVQNPATDTITVDLHDQPVTDEKGNFIFRPAGHGALLENLNARDTDILFIKNIDNVVPDRLKGPTVRFKRILAGVLLEFQSRIFLLLQRMDRGEDVFAEARQLLHTLGVQGDMGEEEVHALLNRPIRVCGMVKNQGEPGGGPFWVKEGSRESLQIVEGAQVNKQDPNQSAIFQSCTHFNPVDVVCGIRNYRGEKFDLLKYRDLNTGFIAQKSHEGKTIKALELPGLWNGSMAFWNTIFVEVPQITFNPVKTVNDLLRPEHQP